MDDIGPSDVHDCGALRERHDPVRRKPVRADIADPPYDDDGDAGSWDPGCPGSQRPQRRERSPSDDESIPESTPRSGEEEAPSDRDDH